MKRKRIDKPTPRMRDTAWRTLHEVAADPLAADHARVSASRAIVRGDTDDDTPAKDKAPPVITWLPYDGRNPTLTQLGFHGDPQQAVVIYDGKSEAGLSDLERWRAEHAARVKAYNEPPKVALTGAERMRLHRAHRSAKLMAPPAG